KIAKNHESKLLQARGFENLAELYEARGNLEQSNIYLIKAGTIYEQINYPFAPIIHKLMQNYLQQGLSTKAIQAGEQALSKTNITRHQEPLLEVLIKAYTRRGN